MPRKQDEPVFDDDNPEWTAEDFARATRVNIKAKDITPEFLASLPRTRGPQKAPTKVPVSIRLSADVVAHYKATGPGWQSRIDDTLRKAAKLKAG
ncbi:BrnA antitoxin family protein [Rhodopseudomonas sp. B29]|uniref:BrnA antitoxin family protein n=1 Tax=Rhodopseudomonas sp. B29 TaxID=95607 RepID=UPI00034AC340|nr:BrnA antitoxin family protein [Rhodopseudomonas sp. B29]